MKHTWWKEAVVYQVYWRSFFDTNGDGIGDLEGVIQKLDYIQSLGVNVIWLNPCYDSPDVDNGYDISDYYGILNKAGDMETFRRLLREVHARGMKLIADLVVNHTSNQHPWFLESKKSRDNQYRDYYIWRDQPNNWRSYFTPSVWEYDEQTNQYYFHSFAVEQPDLNWENPTLRLEIYAMMKFWLDQGIDGFRLDAIALLAKEPGFPDAENPSDISYLGNHPKVHEYLREMNEQVFSNYDCFTVGEVAFVTPEDGIKYVDERRSELNTLFHFQVLDEMPSWDLKRFINIQNNWYNALQERGWNSQFINNHDHTRVVTRYGNDQNYRVESAKLFATMIHTLPGIPYIYQGEEIGMTGVRYTSIEEYDDIAMKNKYNEEVSAGRDPKEVLASLQKLSRDNSRTPMQWDDTKHAGFTTGIPWIKVNPNYTYINVKQELEQPNSIFSFYQGLIRLRKQHPVMIYGEYEDLSSNYEGLYVYKRSLEDTSWLIVLNPSEEIRPFFYTSSETILLSNYEDVSDVLHPYEARIYQLETVQEISR